jgi:bifunctional non-homologous end joining protein LigD
MALDEYRAKRDFRKTAEPPARRGKGHRRPIFVVQEHHASHLHYDLRLEADGVLKSWAVPKGPSLDPAQKRLAVQVEDHPLDYATFEGTIPEGQYGAGTVAIWDRGTYENLMEDKAEPQTVSEAIEAGRLEFVLYGEKLEGRFVLLRMKGPGRGKPQWLLIKMKDEFARSDGLSDGAADGKPKPESRPKAEATPTPMRSTIRRDRFREFTHTDRVMFPDSGITKGDVLDYYERVADRLLPFLRDRPVTLERLPEGLAGPKAPRFWQKNTPASYPDWIPRVALQTEQGKSVHYALVNDESTLLYLVNQGALTFHIWASRVPDLDRPDFVLFDLDPGEATMADAVQIAKRLHETLRDGGVEAVVKTSGKAGLHVLTPWGQPGGYDEARAWALSVAVRVAGEMPERATTEIRKAKRGGRVYIDVLQNARGHHAVPPYVIRAEPGAPVSTPLSWRELTPRLDPSRYNLKTIGARLARLKSDPMEALGIGRRPRASSRR